MTTPRDIIQLALKDCGALGVGQTASAEDMNDGFTRLQWMLSQWQRKRWLIWHLIDLSIISTGAQSYSVGPGGDIETATRPDKLESAFIRQIVAPNGLNVDYPLELLMSYEDYANIAIKKLVSFSGYAFLDSGYPLGTLYPWPVPQAHIYEVHIQVKEILRQFSSIDQDIVLPEEYLPAMEYNLAVRLYPAYGLTADPDVKLLAKDSLNVLRVSNTQIARLQMPTDLTRPGVYNPYSDQIR